MQLTNTSVAQLFTVPESDWTALNQRVGYAEMLRSIADQVSRSLPMFPQLLIACDLWKGTTFPGLMSHAVALSAYADHFTNEFAALQNALAALGQHADPLPPSVTAQAAAALRDVQDASQTCGAEFAALSQQITDFASINSQIDAQLTRYWPPLGPVLGVTDAAAQKVRGVWLALTSDLDDALSGPLDITDEFLRGLEIAAAITAWGVIKAEASAFGTIAGGQQQYWIKPW